MRCVAAIDVGGTFTDISLADLEQRRLWTTKTPTTPDDPSQGFAAGLAKVLEQAGKTSAEVIAILHGSTVATNLIIERKGSPLALLTTQGCRYVLHIGRHDVPKQAANMYLWVKPPRLVTPEHIYEIPERLDHMGRVLQALDETACIEIFKQLQAQKFPVLAIALLHAYANPVHEQRLRDLCQQYCPDALVSISSDVLPQFREYERTMATVLNAYVLPQVGRYYGLLERRMQALGVRAPMLIMKSNGGMASVAAAAQQPILTALSGPAAAVVGVIAVARQAGFDNCISIDVGGTSADVCLAERGEATLTVEGELADLPLHFPMLDVHSIGAGGGSLARVATGGSLQVGPDSAGADPGPVCYGRGGHEPTVTDAHLALGRLNPSLLDGELELDRDSACDAICQRIAQPLELSLEAAASGILEILNHTMVGAIRAISIERGYDPRDFALLACGGAGPLHAGRLAELLGMPHVIVPCQAGVLSTQGLLSSDIKNDYVRTLMQRQDVLDLTVLSTVLADLATQARAWLTAEGIAEPMQQLRRSADLRYANQGYEITVAVPAGPITPETLEQTVASFHAEHERLYTYASPELAVEIVNLRVSARGPAWPFTSQPRTNGQNTAVEPDEMRPVYFPALGDFTDCPVYDYAILSPGVQLTGPAILTQALTTIVIEPNHQAHMDAYGNIVMSIPGLPSP